ncbi:hypothetical protein FOA52_000912 [Chlamydomonas sp. UWO 241]|nr:hypothetical protein FOA52_000912 [Chlamydomonas sp. UWO 241]
MSGTSQTIDRSKPPPSGETPQPVGGYGYSLQSCLWLSAAALFIGLLSNPSYVARLHETLAVTDQQPPGSCDAIIVLGYALSPAGVPLGPLAGRVTIAWQALRHGVAPVAVLSGAHSGTGLRGMSEANAMLTQARAVSRATAQPFNEEQWIKEEESTSTRENALYSLRLAQARGWSSITLVTNTFHQRRSLLTFRKAAAQLCLAPGDKPVSVYVTPMPFAGHQNYPLIGTAKTKQMDLLVDLWDFVRELAALAYYKAKGFI